MIKKITIALLLFLVAAPCGTAFSASRRPSVGRCKPLCLPFLCRSKCRPCVVECQSPCVCEFQFFDPPCCGCRECGCGLDPCNDECESCRCKSCASKMEGDFSLAGPYDPVVDKYVIAVGDSLEISVFGDEDTLVDNAIVAPDGHIYYFFLDGIQAEGLSLEELRVELEEKLADYFLAPAVSIIPRAMTSQMYTLLGRVTSPGLYPLQQATSLRQAIGAAGGIITDREGFSGGLSGGVNGSGRFSRPAGFGGKAKFTDLKHSYIVRNGHKLPIDFEKLIYSPDNSQDITLKPGDYIYIASQESRNIYVLGAAVGPSVLGYYDGMTLVGTISSVGGWREGPYGADLRRLLIIRGSLKCPKVMYVDLCCILNGKARDVYLEPGDIVYFTEKKFAFGRELVRLAVNAFISAFTNEAGNFYADELFD